MVAEDSPRIAQTNDRSFDVDGIVGNTSVDAGAMLAPSVVDAITDAGVTLVASPTDPVITGDPTGTLTSDADIPTAVIGSPLVQMVNVPTVPPLQIAPIDFGSSVQDILQANPNLYYGTPLQPSIPVVTPIIGGLKVGWDGNNADGSEDKVPDFDHLEVHVSEMANFNPIPTTLQATIQATIQGGAGIVYPTTRYGVPQYIRFVAVTRSGARSAPSNIAEGSPQQIDATDITGDIGTVQTFQNNTHFIF